MPSQTATPTVRRPQAAQDVQLVDDQQHTDGLAPAVVTGHQVELDPRWDRARQLLRQGQQCATMLAEEIERLRRLYLGQGRNDTLKRGNAPIFTSVKNGNDNDLRGFVAELRAQLDMHPQTAARLLEQAGYQRRIHALADGQAVVLDDGTEIVPTPEIIESALEATRTLAVPFSPPASRVWAGLFGRKATKGGDRAPVDHQRNLRRALVALATSLEHYATFDPEARATFDTAWQELLDAGVVPAAWAAAAATKFEQRNPRR